jgi:hypothetical protein
MAKKRKIEVREKRRSRKETAENKRDQKIGFWGGLRDETRNSIIGIFLILIAVILLVAAFGNSGYLGGVIYNTVHFLFGLGYYVLPALFVLLGVNFFRAGGHNFTTPALVAGPFFLLSALGLLSLMDSASLSAGLGGFIGYYIMSPMVWLFQGTLTAIIFSSTFVVAILILFDTPLHLGFMFSFFKFLKPKGREDEEEFMEEDDDEPALVEASTEPLRKETPPEELPKEEISEEKSLFEKVLPLNAKKGPVDTTPFRFNSTLHTEYIPPPLSLLASDKGKP